MTAFTLNNKTKFDLFVILVGIIATVGFAVKGYVYNKEHLYAYAFMSFLITTIYAKLTDISSNV
jgi:multisubunit Na+/H+ antiporter MnhF subunit